jgi:hypothetical protein
VTFRTGGDASKTYLAAQHLYLIADKSHRQFQYLKLAPSLLEYMARNVKTALSETKRSIKITLKESKKILIYSIQS